MLVRRWGELNVVAGASLARVLLVLDVNPGSTTALLLLLLELTLQETGGGSKHGGASIKNKAKQLKQCIRWAAADAVGKSHRSELQCNTSASNASDGASKSHLSVKCNTWQWHGGNKWQWYGGNTWQHCGMDWCNDGNGGKEGQRDE